jgi:transposase
MSRKHYPSDISREQFALIRPLLEGARKKTAPRKWDLYDIFCAILYLLKNTATWRALPGDFPSPSTVRYHFDHWSKISEDGTESLLQQALKKSGGARAREQRTAALDALLHRGRAKRQDHGYGSAQRPEKLCSIYSQPLPQRMQGKSNRESPDRLYSRPTDFILSNHRLVSS